MELVFPVREPGVVGQLLYAGSFTSAAQSHSVEGLQTAVVVVLPDLFAVSPLFFVFFFFFVFDFFGFAVWYAPAW